MGNRIPLTGTNLISSKNFFVSALCISVSLFISSCSTSSHMNLPGVYEVPSLPKLPIDGTWELQLESGVGAVFKIEAGKMYVYGNYGSGAWHGMVIAKNIRQTSPLKYTCEAASRNPITGKMDFGPGKIEVLSTHYLLLRYFPHPATDSDQTRVEMYRKLRLDDKDWFLSQLSHDKEKHPSIHEK